MSILPGAIADDFTGATDLASTPVKQGMRVTQMIDVPKTELEETAKLFLLLKDN